MSLELTLTGSQEIVMNDIQARTNRLVESMSGLSVAPTSLPETKFELVFPEDTVSNHVGASLESRHDKESLLQTMKTADFDTLTKSYREAQSWHGYDGNKDSSDGEETVEVDLDDNLSEVSTDEELEEKKLCEVDGTPVEVLELDEDEDMVQDLEDEQEHLNGQAYDDIHHLNDYHQNLTYDPEKDYTEEEVEAFEAKLEEFDELSEPLEARLTQLETLADDFDQGIRDRVQDLKSEYKKRVKYHVWDDSVRVEFIKKLNVMDETLVSLPEDDKEADDLMSIGDIAYEQDRTKLRLDPIMFRRLCQEVLYDTTYNSTTKFRMTNNAIAQLQHAAEAHLISVLEGSNTAAEHAQRDYIIPQDVQLVRYLS
jgi:histone H3/H4